MTTARRITLVHPARLALIAVLTVALGACSSAAAPSAPPSAPALSPSPSQPPSAGLSSGPDDPVTQPADPGAGGGSSGSGGIGGSGDGGDLVIPHPGTINPHPVSVQSMVTNVDGRHVTAKLTWTSGVEPCHVLDSVVVSRDGSAIDVTVVEGAADANAICIDLAKTKSTIVDLGELEPGTYTIAATNSQIPPVSVTVS
jgi:hypothetical protein